MTHGERHDAGASRGHKDVGDAKDAAAAATQLLPLVTPVPLVDALRNVARQLNVRHLVLPHRHQVRLRARQCVRPVDPVPEWSKQWVMIPGKGGRQRP